jgi:hypothetical protein
MTGDPTAFRWTELERLTRTRASGGRVYQRRCVRARCECGTVRVMSASEFKLRKTLCCNRCRLRRAQAEGWAHSRIARTRSEP